MINILKNKLLNLFRVQYVKSLFFSLFLIIFVFSALIYKKAVDDADFKKRDVFFVTNYVGLFFSDLEKTISLVGDNIRFFGSDNLYIEKILNTFSKSELSYFLGSYVSWADANGNIIVSGKKGILSRNELKNLSDRPCFALSKKADQLLRFSGVTKNMFSSRQVLPTNMMVCNEKKEPLGFIVFGLNLDSLISHLRQFMAADSILKINFHRDGLLIKISLLDYEIEQKQPDSDKFISIAYEKSYSSIIKSIVLDYFLYFFLLILFLYFIYINNKIIKKVY